jgi:hypothetical protein
MIKKTESIEVSNKDKEVIVIRSSFFDLPNKKTKRGIKTGYMVEPKTLYQSSI